MRKLLLGATIGVLVMSAAAGAYWWLFVNGQDDDEPTWTVSAYSGEVMVSSGRSELRPVEMKARLRGNDRIRTLDDGEVTLVHGQSHVTIRAGTELAVGELTWGASDFELSRGRVFVESRGTRVRMSGFAGQVADTSDAGFGMTVTDDGTARVDVKRGALEFSNEGHSEDVVEGESSTAKPGERPSPPVKIPDSLLMNVRFPDADTFNTKLARVRGTVRPGDLVSVGGRRVETDEEGRFEVDVRLEEGMNEIEVVAEDATGRRMTKKSHGIRVDTTPPLLSGVVIGRHSIDE